MVQSSRAVCPDSIIHSYTLPRQPVTNLPFDDDQKLFALMKEQLYSAVLCDALDQVGYRQQAMRADIRPIYPGSNKVANAPNSYNILDRLNDPSPTEKAQSANIVNKKDLFVSPELWKKIQGKLNNTSLHDLSVTTRKNKNNYN